MEQHPFFEQLRQRTPALMEPGRQSAVFLPFVAQPDGWHILLEQRSAGLRQQPGEICLPGGGIEPGEGPAAAALRETCEELCVQPRQLTLWGPGDVLTTPGGQTIHSFLGQLRDYDGGFSPDEVHRTFTIPVQWLLDHPPEQHMAGTRTFTEADFPHERVPGGRAYPWRSGRWPVYFYSWPGCELWGITAKILYHTLQMVEEMGGLPPIIGER